MKILGIETSCDETAAAVVENGTKILSSVIASSAQMHAKTGGIIPEEAARQQVVSILPVVKSALSQSGSEISDIDSIAVTVGPGLIGSLLVGVETARTLAVLWQKPLIPVNHLVAHIYANFIRETQNSKFQKPNSPEFPALALVVSGGHTDLVLMKSHTKIEWVGGTRDDAAGEAFDKTARLLHLPYPGGPSIANSAAKYLALNHQPLTLFPRPMVDEANFDWSFSGLKTAVLREIQKLEIRSGKKSNFPLQYPASNIEPLIPKLAAEIQEAIVDVLVTKTLAAASLIKPKSLLLAGGVAANTRLREKFELAISHQSLTVDFRVPPPPLCTDNAAYIASCAYFAPHAKDWTEITANPQLAIVGAI